MRRTFCTRRGITRVDVVVLAGLGILAVFVVGYLLLPTRGSAFETQRSQHCRENLRRLATAIRQYADMSRVGELPGYIDVLERQDGFAYHDPRTRRVEPVSWVVMILPELNEMDLAAAWRSGDSPEAGKPIGTPAVEKTHRYLEYLVCPSDPQPNRTGTPTCYAVNTGIPDYLTGPNGLPPIHAPRGACRCEACGGKAVAESAVEYAPARDLAANGLFFDRFTSSRHYDPAVRTRPVFARLEGIVDPKDRTILLTDNVDATNYGLEPYDPADFRGSLPPELKEMYATAEAQLGLTWAPDSTLLTGGAPGSGSAPRSETVSMQPPVEAQRFNVEGGLGDGISYHYARPSSKHPNAVNVAFADGSVLLVKDTLSYFVYVKLMTPDDRNAAAIDARGNPVPLPAAFGTYQLTDYDVSP